MDEVKQVLYLSYDGMTDPLGQSQVLPYITGLSRHGYSFTLISCEKPDRYQKNRAIIEKICHESNIDWKPLVYHKSPPILSTIWDVYTMYTMVCHLNTSKNFNIVHCRGYLPALIGLKMKEKFGMKFIFDMRGFWADEKVDAGAWNLNKFHYRKVYQFFKNKEKEFFLQADASVSLTQAGKSEIQSWDYMQGKKDNISVIPCCVDVSLFSSKNVSEDSRNEWKQRLKIRGEDVVLSYLGSIGTWYMLDEMLDFFVEFRKEYSAAKFLFITHDEHEKILSLANRKGISESIIIQPAQRNEVASLLSLSQVSIFFIRSTYSKIGSSPTKQGEIMAMGIPIICNVGVGDTDTIVQKYQAGILISKFESKEYHKAILELKDREFDSNKIRERAIEYFGLEEGINKYLSIYTSIC